MAHTYTISDLAKEFDLTTRAIRFYEDMGLLQPERNGPAGRSRVYSARDRTRLRRVGAGAHVQRRGGQPGSIDADHRSHSRSQAAHEADASKGQLTVTEPVGRLISMRMSVKVLACGSSGDKARLPISPTLGG